MPFPRSTTHHSALNLIITMFLVSFVASPPSILVRAYVINTASVSSAGANAQQRQFTTAASSLTAPISSLASKVIFQSPAMENIYNEFLVASKPLNLRKYSAGGKQKKTKKESKIYYIPIPPMPYRFIPGIGYDYQPMRINPILQEGAVTPTATTTPTTSPTTSSATTLPAATTTTTKKPQKKLQSQRQQQLQQEQLQQQLQLLQQQQHQQQLQQQQQQHIQYQQPTLSASQQQFTVGQKPLYAITNNLHKTNKNKKKSNKNQSNNHHHHQQHLHQHQHNHKEVNGSSLASSERKLIRLNRGDYHFNGRPFRLQVAHAHPKNHLTAENLKSKLYFNKNIIY